MPTIIISNKRENLQIIIKNLNFHKTFELINKNWELINIPCIVKI